MQLENKQDPDEQFFTRNESHDVNMLARCILEYLFIKKESGLIVKLFGSRVIAAGKLVWNTLEIPLDDNQNNPITDKVSILDYVRKNGIADHVAIFVRKYNFLLKKGSKKLDGDDILWFKMKNIGAWDPYIQKNDPPPAAQIPPSMWEEICNKFPAYYDMIEMPTADQQYWYVSDGSKEMKKLEDDTQHNIADIRKTLFLRFEDNAVYTLLLAKSIITRRQLDGVRYIYKEPAKVSITKKPPVKHRAKKSSQITPNKRVSERPPDKTTEITIPYSIMSACEKIKTTHGPERQACVHRMYHEILSTYRLIPGPEHNIHLCECDATECPSADKHLLFVSGVLERLVGSKAYNQLRGYLATGS